MRGATGIVAPLRHSVLVEIESEFDEMHIGSEARSIGRFVVDIDNCLRATDSRYLTAYDVLALHGGLDPDAAVIWETNGQSILLAPGDRIEMDENRVDFFRTVKKVAVLRPAISRQAGQQSGFRNAAAMAA